MKDNLILQDKNYISARRVHELFGYTSDYVGQLCRSGKLDCKMIGRSWFVTEKSIIDHKMTVNEVLKNKSKESRKVAKKIYNQNNVKSEIVVEKVIVNDKVNVSPVVEATPVIEISSPAAPTVSPVIPELSPIALVAEIANKIDSEISKQAVETNPVVVVEEIISPVVAVEHPITFVPSNFSLPYVISESFLIAPGFAQYRTRNISQARSLTLNNLNKVYISVGFAMIAFMFLFQSSIFPSNLARTSSSASVASASKELFREIWNSIFGGSKSDNIAEVEKSPPTASPSFGGLAVIPSSNSNVQDEVIKQKIRDSFSDEVQVNPDKSGTAGVITPVFKKAKGENFVYVLVPVMNEASKN